MPGHSHSGLGSCILIWLRELWVARDPLNRNWIFTVNQSFGDFLKLFVAEFLQFCENSIRSFDPRCAENVKVAFHNLESYMQTEEGREKLELMFNENR